LGEEGERSQSSDFFGSHAPVENEDENDDEDDSGGTYTALNRFRVYPWVYARFMPPIEGALKGPGR
jgi:hypothetical protein